MGHNNYSKFSKHFKNKESNVVETNNVLEGQMTIDELINVEDTNETVNETAMGFVSGCEKLFVREKPGKEFNHITIIPKNSEVKINLTDSTEEFYKVTTSMGFEGYCMKKFITIK